MTARIFHYRCPLCQATREVPSEEGDPGPIYICACKRLARYWCSRPAVAFVKPDTIGMTFGPSAAELADTGRPHARVRDNPADMGAFDEPLPKMPAHVQGKLF